MMGKRFIDADKLALKWMIASPKQRETFRQIIDEEPTADVEEVKHGEWIRHEPNPEKMRDFHNQGIGVVMAENSIYWTCSICGDWGVPHNKYCRECGAKMDGEKKEGKEK